MEWYQHGALGDARIVQSAIFVCTSQAIAHHSIWPPMPKLQFASSTRSLTLRPSSRRRGAFTLVELLIATVVLSVGLLALSSAGVAIVRLESRGRRLSRAAGAAETRLELLRARGCTAGSGVSASGALEERWSAVTTTSATLVLTDTVLPARSGGEPTSHTYVFRSAIPC
jgi:prepilin-type N-terminal cleavage/methylation domain-containing protein